MIEKMLQRDLLVKVTAVVLALLMWVQVIGEKNPLETRTVNLALDLNAQALPGKWVKYTGQAKVAVTLEGRARTLAQINPDKIKVPVDLSKAGVGQPVTVPVVFTSPAPGVRVVDVTPKTITVDIDVEDKKEVSVSVSVRGVPNEDFEAETPVLPAATVMVSGPKKKLDQVQTATGEVDVTGAVAAVTTKVSLVAKDAAGNEVGDITVAPLDLQVTVPMKSRPPRKTVPVRVETSGAPKTGYRAGKTAVTPDSVKIRGELQITRQIDALYTAPVDLTDRDASFSYAVDLVVPSGVSAEVTRVTVNVEVVEDIVERVFSKVPVLLESPPVGYSFVLQPAEVDIVLTGRSDILAQIKADQIEAFIDASSIPLSALKDKTTYSAKLIVMPRGVQDLSVEIKPAQVTLTLTKR